MPTKRTLLLVSVLFYFSNARAEADFSLLVTNANTNSVLRFDAGTGADLGVFAQDTGTVSGLAYGPDHHLYVPRVRGRTSISDAMRWQTAVDVVQPVSVDDRSNGASNRLGTPISMTSTSPV